MPKKKKNKKKILKCHQIDDVADVHHTNSFFLNWKNNTQQSSVLFKANTQIEQKRKERTYERNKKNEWKRQTFNN